MPDPSLMLQYRFGRREPKDPHEWHVFMGTVEDIEDQEVAACGAVLHEQGPPLGVSAFPVFGILLRELCKHCLKETLRLRRAK